MLFRFGINYQQAKVYITTNHQQPKQNYIHIYLFDCVCLCVIFCCFFWVQRGHCACAQDYCTHSWSRGMRAERAYSNNIYMYITIASRIWEAIAWAHFVLVLVRVFHCVRTTEHRATTHTLSRESLYCLAHPRTHNAQHSSRGLDWNAVVGVHIYVECGFGASLFCVYMLRGDFVAFVI